MPYQFHYTYMSGLLCGISCTEEVLSEFTALDHVISDLMMALFVLLVTPPFRAVFKKASEIGHNDLANGLAWADKVIK
jgi:hypothetical protein